MESIRFHTILPQLTIEKGQYFLYELTNHNVPQTCRRLAVHVYPSMADRPAVRRLIVGVLAGINSSSPRAVLGKKMNLGHFGLNGPQKDYRITPLSSLICGWGYYGKC